MLPAVLYLGCPAFPPLALAWGLNAGLHLAARECVVEPGDNSAKSQAENSAARAVSTFAIHK